MNSWKDLYKWRIFFPYYIDCTAGGSHSNIRLDNARMVINSVDASFIKEGFTAVSKYFYRLEIMGFPADFLLLK